MSEALLDQMARTSRARLDRALAERPAAAWRERALAAPRPVLPALPPFGVIAECKRRAPSAGRLAGPGAGSLAERARAYARGGAWAISVLTEPDRFDGALSHLGEVAAAVSLPVMRKDFLVDPVQVFQGRAAGACGVLLIVRMVDDRTLGAMLDAAAACGLFALVECFDAADARRARIALAGRDRVLVGVNTRDLRTLQVRSERLERLVDHLPPDLPWVAESGIHTPAEAERAARLGYRAVLVGTALMRAADPAARVAALAAAGRAACG